VLGRIQQREIALEPIRASINQDQCSGCRICNNLCPFNAILFHEDRMVSEVNPALCQGCGTCVAACPAGAIAGTGFSNEQILAQIEGLQAPKGRWPNEPLATRQVGLAPVLRLPPGRWWSLAGFLESLRRHQPGFLRPGGDFDSWFLQDAQSGDFLPGLEAWDRVEGALLTYLLTGPLHWLGAVDLGGEGRPGRHSAFRLTPAAQSLIEPQTAPEIPEPRRRARLAADGRITVPRAAARSLRYQVSRFSRWIQLDRRQENFVYQITPASLRGGREAGLLPRHMLAVLQDVTGTGVPKSLEKAIRRWGERGQEAALSRLLVLRVSSAKVLEELQSHPSTGRFLGEGLGPDQVVVQESEWLALCSAALRRGILIDWPPEESEGSG